MAGQRRGGVYSAAGEGQASLNVMFDGLDELVADLQANSRVSGQALLPRKIRKASKKGADLIVRDAKARAHGPQLSKAAKSIRTITVGDETFITAGGSQRVFSGGGSYTDVFFGADFGSTGRYKQFPSFRKGGRTIYPAWDDRWDEVGELMMEAIEDYWADPAWKRKVGRAGRSAAGKFKQTATGAALRIGTFGT